MKTLRIKWTRLVDSRGRTCKRCGATEKQVEKAARGLRATLARFGVKVSLEKRKLSRKGFLRDTLKSNRVEINGRLLEKWVNARTGRTYCCDACGGAECRTVKIGKKVYETVPAELIVKAALAAAAQMLKGVRVGACCGSGKAGKAKACGCGCGRRGQG